MGRVYTLLLHTKTVRTRQTTTLREQLTVLVAHGNETLRALRTDAPALRGHRVRVATDERTTYEVLASEEIHLLLLDLHLLQGNRLMTLLRQQKKRRERPPFIVALSDLM